MRVALSIMSNSQGYDQKQMKDNIKEALYEYKVLLPTGKYHTMSYRDF